MRGDIPDALRESQRFSASIVRFAMAEVLVTSIYGFANRYREGKRPNDLLLMSIIPVITEVGLPLIICGDFNENRYRNCHHTSALLIWGLLRLSNGITPGLASCFLQRAVDPPEMLRPSVIRWLLNGLLT